MKMCWFGFQLMMIPMGKAGFETVMKQDFACKKAVKRRPMVASALMCFRISL